MRPTRHVFTLALASVLAAGLAAPASAQQTIKIGELNSYKAAPAFLEPYKKGWQLAIEEIKKLKNAQSVLLRQQQELHARQDVISGVCDAFSARLARLTEEVADRD